MKILINKVRQEEEEVEVKRVTIINGDIEFEIYMDKGDVVVRKNNFGEGSSSIMITPCVSNQITIK